MNNARIVLSVILAVHFLSAYGAAALSSAPYDPGFVAWQSSGIVQNEMEALAAGSGHGLGYIPPPFDWSHLAAEKAKTGAAPMVSLPAAFTLRGTGMTSVKNQGQCGDCWAFGTYGALESWLLKNRGETWDFSEQNLKTNTGYDLTCCQGGNASMSVAYLSRWSGPVAESAEPYISTDSAVCTPVYGLPVQKYLDSEVIFSTSADIKNALMGYGALNTTMYMNESSSYYNSTTHCYYYPGSASINHSVTIAGWNDTMTVAGAPGKGAWLIKNSWGKSWGDSGYFWISYNDTTACQQGIAFSGAVPVTTYAANYYYDTLGQTEGLGYSADSGWAANIFTATRNEALTAVGFYALSNGASYTVNIYGTFSKGSFSNLLGTVSGTAAFAGYYTVALPSQILIASGGSFGIAVKFVTPGYNYPIPIENAIAGYSSKVTVKAGRSYTSSSGASYSDLSTFPAAVCIRGLTVTPAAPIAPTLNLPANGAANQPLGLTLTWNTVLGAANYQVQVSTVSTFVSTVVNDSALTGASQAIGALLNNTTYYWRVNAANIAGSGPWSWADSFTTIAAPPGAPALVSPANGAANQPLGLTLTWNTVLGAANYQVQVSTVSTFVSTVVNDSALTGASQAIGALLNNTTYYWRVNAANIGGASAWATDSFTTLLSLRTPIGPGWNVISLNIHPQDSTAAGLFGSLRGFVLAKTLAKVYWPAEGLYNFDTLHAVQGCQLYSDSTDTVRQSGGMVAPTTPISMSMGWSLVSYLPQTAMPVQTAVASIDSQVVVVKDGAGKVYWPDTSININTIGNMKPGAGYYIYVNNAANLVYPAGAASKTLAYSKHATIFLPEPRRFALGLNTGNNATILSKRITINGAPAPDSSEVGVFDAKGDLVGAGVVIHGATAFSIWGKSELGKSPVGLGASERMAFRLWNGSREYPLEFHGSFEPLYAKDALFFCSFVVPSADFISKFALANAYPNPFRGNIRIFFDVPEIAGKEMQNVEINVYDIKGSIVARLANGEYKAGHYGLAWDGGGGQAARGSNMYIVQMKAAGYEKKLKLFRVQ